MKDNNAQDALPPAQRRPKRDILTPDEARTLLASLASDRYGVLIETALATGCRLGEVLGLRWTAVDLVGGTARIEHTLQRLDKQWKLVEPKTEGSVRTVTLPTFLVDSLKAHHRRQAERRLAYGSEWRNELGLVFTTDDGGPLDGRYVNRLLKARLAAAGLPPFHFHDLRHACATFLLGEKVPVRVVSDHLGHSDVRLTQQTYQHVLDEMRSEVADTLGRVLAREA